MPYSAARTYRAHIWEYPPPRVWSRYDSIKLSSYAAKVAHAVHSTSRELLCSTLPSEIQSVE